MPQFDESKPHRIHSKKLCSDIILVPDIETARDLYKGGHREPMYLHEEVEGMKGIDLESLKVVNAWKEIMPGSIVAGTGLPVGAADDRWQYKV